MTLPRIRAYADRRRRRYGRPRYRCCTNDDQTGNQRSLLIPSRPENDSPQQHYRRLDDRRGHDGRCQHTQHENMMMASSDAAQLVHDLFAVVMVGDDVDEAAVRVNQILDGHGSPSHPGKPDFTCRDLHADGHAHLVADVAVVSLTD